MTTLELKADLFQLIDKIHDVDILKSFRNILSMQTKKDFWNHLSDAEKDAIDKGLHDLEKGSVFSYDEIRKQIKMKYKV